MTPYEIYKLINCLKQTQHKQHTPLYWPSKLTMGCSLVKLKSHSKFGDYCHLTHHKCIPFLQHSHSSGRLIHGTPNNILTLVNSCRSRNTRQMAAVLVTGTHNVDTLSVSHYRTQRNKRLVFVGESSVHTILWWSKQRYQGLPFY